MLTAVAPGACVLAVFILTLAPTVTGEDSGELITAAHCFGVPHPPGYPLWTILCGLWTHVVPIGSIAWRANLFSAVCTALGVGILASALRQMHFTGLVAGAAAAACGLTAAVWSQSVITEVYTLNLPLMAVLMWLVVRWHRDGRRRGLIWASLVFGLGMANHQIIGFTALGLGIWALFRRPALLRQGRLVAGCAALFVVGLLPYAYLLWAGGRDVPVRWGETDSVAAAWEHASRGQYKSDHPIAAPIPETAGRLAGRFYYGIRWEVRQFTPVLMPLLVAGMVWLWRRKGRRPLFWLVVMAGACCGPLYLAIGGPRLDRQDEFVQKVFLTPLAFISAIPLAAGLQWLVQSLRTQRQRFGARAYRVGMAASAMLVVGVPLVAHWRDNNLRNYWYAHDHGRNMLACLLPDAILFPSGDHNTFPLLYLIHVEGQRPDVTVADKYGYIDLDLYADMPNNPGKPRTPEQREAIEEWIIRTARRPVYYTVKKPSPVGNARTAVVGLTYHLLPDGMNCDTQSCWSRIRYRNLEGLDAPEDYAAANILADYHYALAMKDLADGRGQRARQRFDECLRHAWGIKEIYNNVGSALAEAGMVSAAIGYYEQAARLDWRYAPGRWNLAKVFRSLGKYAWSARVFEDLARATPGDFRPYGELGFLYRNHFNDIERARTWWYESLRLNPRQSQIIAALAASEQSAVVAAERAGLDTHVATSQPGIVVSNATRPAATAPTEATAGRLSLSESGIDFGRLVGGFDQILELTLQNAGTAPLTILGVEASCACVVSELAQESLLPGESAPLQVRLKTAGKDGHVEETLTIRSDDPDNPAQRVTLRAEVVPEVTTEPEAVHLSALPDERPDSFEIAITNNAGQAFRIEQVHASPSWVRFDWPKKATAATHVLQVTCIRPVSESVAGAIEIQTTLPDHKVVRVPFTFETTMPARATPSLVYLGRVQRGQRVRRTVRIDPIRSGLTLELKLAGESHVPGLEAELRKADDRSSSWRLDITVVGSAATSGPFKQVIQIAIAGCDKVIEVPLHGYVAE